MATDIRRGVTASCDVAVRVRELCREFADRRVVRSLDLDVCTGEFVVLLGASGCGKSTLLRILAGLDDDFTGTVEVEASKAVAFQSPQLLPWKRVWTNVVLGMPRRGAAQAAAAALAEVNLEHLANVWPKTLSGGEAQRVALARALVRRPRVLLLDEPFGALDALTRLKAQRLVESLWLKHRPAVVLVTHDVDEALVLADRILVMAGGRIAYSVEIAADRPRRPTSPGLPELREKLLTQLGVDGARSESR